MATSVAWIVRHQRRHSLVVRRLHVAALLDQVLRDLGVLLFGETVERREAVHVGFVHSLGMVGKDPLDLLTPYTAASSRPLAIAPRPIRKGQEQ
jgi:hypothetical protein